MFIGWIFFWLLITVVCSFLMYAIGYSEGYRKGDSEGREKGFLDGAELTERLSLDRARIKK